MTTAKWDTVVQHANAKREYQDLWLRFALEKTYDISLKREQDDSVAFTIHGKVCGFLEPNLAAEIVALMDQGWAFSLECTGIEYLFRNNRAQNIVANMTIYGISANPTQEELAEHEQIEMRKAQILSHIAIGEEMEGKKHSIPMSSSRGQAFSPTRDGSEGLDKRSF